MPSGSEDELELSGEDSDDEIFKIQDLVMKEGEECPEILQDDYLDEIGSIPTPRASSSASVTSNYANVTSQPSTSGHSQLSCSSSDQVNTGSRRAPSRGGPVVPSMIHPTTPIAKPNKKSRRYIWRQMFQPPISTFTGADSLERPYTNFEIPSQYFMYYFDDDLLQHIVEKSTKYSIQKDLGICLLLGLVSQLNIRMLWDSDLGISLIIDTMTLTDFEKLRSVIHFNDNENLKPRRQPGHDRLFSIRPVPETLKKKCQAVPKRETLSVDEQMCATKACNFLRQYLPNGYKLFVLCDDKGFAYDFEIYSGAENDPELRLHDELDLGASCRATMSLRF